MRIARLELDKIGPFDGATFDFPDPGKEGELVLFEGPNGCGKTTLVSLIAAAAGRFGDASPGLGADPRRLHSRAQQDASMVVHFEHAGEHLRETRTPAGAGGLFGNAPSLHRELLTLWEASQQHPSDWKNGLHWAAFAYEGHRRTPPLANLGPQPVGLSPLESALSFGNDVGGPSGMNVGLVLTNLDYDQARAIRSGDASIATSRKDALKRFEVALSEVLDRRVAISFNTVGDPSPRIQFDGQPIPVDALGEGLRSTFSWLADLLVRLELAPWADKTKSPFDQTFWLILDEIEESLHPKMQARLFPAIRKLFPNARIYATTHSPFVVASLGEGTIFPIRPNEKHRVVGEVKTQLLKPGQSLELVTTSIFDAQVGIIDEVTRKDLDEHKADLETLERTGTLSDWPKFLDRRRRLWALNEEVRSLVAFQEVPVRQLIEDHLEDARPAAQ